MRAKVGANRNRAAPGLRCARRSRGVALVEFAVVFPLLALVVFGTVDLGRAYSLQNRLRNAAREGAFYARNYPLRQLGTGSGLCADPENAEHQALNELEVAADSEDDGFVVTFNPSTSCNVASSALESGDKVTVTVQADFEVITPLISNLVGSPIQISESVDVVIQ